MEKHANEELYHCKSCSLPLIIDSTLDLIDESSFTDSFLVINDIYSLPSAVPVTSSEGTSNENRIKSRLFEILSNQSLVDHPLCEDCADFLMDKMDSKLKLLEEECKGYREYLTNLEKKMSQSNGNPSINELKAKINELQCQEKKLIEELKRVDYARQECESHIKKQSEEIKRLSNEEAKYRIEYNHLKSILFECNDERQNIETQKRYAQKHLDMLKKTNVFNATFHIWYEGHFGTINGFRLGRLPSFLVEWSEINAAWGQTVLLLYALAKKMNFTFKDYKLVPFGNHSFIETLEEKPKELPLYGSGGFRYMLNSKFDQAMIAFLNCMKQVGDEIEKSDNTWFLPYRMEKERIEDTKLGYSYSIRMQNNSEEEWTKALKYMLTNLKWILAWVSRPEGSSEESEQEN